MTENIQATAHPDDEDPESVSAAGTEDEATPTQVQRGFGVRRVNNLPVIIAGAIVLGFAAVIAVVAAHRAAVNAPKPAGAATVETVADKSNASQAEQMAASISRKAQPGLVAPLGQPSDAVGIIGAPGDAGSSGNSTGVNGDVSALQQERTRILVMKRTQLEEAIKAPTGVSGGFGRGVGDRSGTSDTGGLPGGAGLVSTNYTGPSGAGAGVSPASMGQLNGARSQIEMERQRAVANARVLTERLNQLSRQRGAATSVDTAAVGASPGVGESSPAGGSAGGGGYMTPSIPAMPTGYGSSGASSSNSRPTRLNDAVEQFDVKDKDEDRWSLNSSMSVPRSPYELRAGAVIPAILISGVNSELPGQIIAQLSENVYDTARGYSLLLPQGSRLIGEYTSNVGYGQSRLMVVWKRIVFPDAKALDIGAMPGTDGAGYGGMKDQVNNHYFRLFAGAVMLSAIEAAVIKSQPQSGISLYPTTQQALDQSLGNQLGQTATQLIQRNMNIAPTLNIRPGYRLNVMVTKDMVFSKPYQAFDY
jgi:type IV secretion system protein VirB10